ncbi:UNVERIFIED_CONTAM: hypothetical protein POZ17_19730 [Ralstonia mannitolilytica]
MSNKKRISKKIRNIEFNRQIVKLAFGFKLLHYAVEYSRAIRKQQLSENTYPSGGSIPNNGGPEKIIDSHGDEKILTKFEIKRHPYFLNTHNPEQS